VARAGVAILARTVFLESTGRYSSIFKITDRPYLRSLPNGAAARCRSPRHDHNGAMTQRYVVMTSAGACDQRLRLRWPLSKCRCLPRRRQQPIEDDRHPCALHDRHGPCHSMHARHSAVTIRSRFLAGPATSEMPSLRWLIHGSSANSEAW
jgi:hypothetical protein